MQKVSSVVKCAQVFDVVHEGNYFTVAADKATSQISMQLINSAKSARKKLTSLMAVHF